LANKKKTTKEFKVDVRNKYGNKVKILSEYSGLNNKIEFVYYCEKHGETYGKINAKNIISKTFQPCKKCANEVRSDKLKNRKSSEKLFNDFKKLIKDKGGELLNKEWVNSKFLYTIDCGNENHPNFKNSHDKIMHSNQWCPYCCGRKGNFQDNCEKIISNKGGILLNKYVNSKTYLKVKCIKHNYTWNIYPPNLFKGRWCPICNLPKSEIAVFDFLQNNNYNFEIQYKFDNLRSKNNEYLRFDFVIFNDNKEILTLIESDGFSHFNNSNKNSYNYKTYKTDIVKNKYCIDNNINLIRVFYNNKWIYKEHYNYLIKELKPKINNLKEKTNNA